MKLYKKIIIGLGFAVLLVGGFFLHSRYTAIYDAAIEKRKIETVSFIRERALQFVATEDFASNDVEYQRQVFKNFWENIQSPEWLRIKVWDTNYTIIWSDLSGLIGQRFADNHEVAESLEGHIEFEVDLVEKGEHVSEREYWELSEIYVPILDAQGAVVGVVEVYRPMISLRENVRAEFQKYAISFTVITLIGYGALSSIIYFFLKRREVVGS